MATRDTHAVGLPSTQKPQDLLAPCLPQSDMQVPGPFSADRPLRQWCRHLSPWCGLDTYRMWLRV